MQKIVGQGRFGIVYLAETVAEPHQQVAVKVLRKGTIDDKKIAEEVRILRELDHPNIVKYYEQFEDGPYIYIVTEYCSGGELFDRIAGKEIFNESEAAGIIEELLSAIEYCHSKRIAHRDIKPENILYASSAEHARVKLIDFGLAKLSEKQLCTYQSIVGTPSFVAPEVIDGNYTLACDIWSLGIVLHVMLSGYLPFRGETTEDIFRSIKKGQLNFSLPVWKKVTPPGKELLSMLLEPEETKRPKASEALKHRWFTEVKAYTPEVNELDKDVMKTILKVHGTARFQKACINVFVRHMKADMISNLTHIFHSFDKEHTGYIPMRDFVKAMRDLCPQDEIHSILSRLDCENHGVINYNDFLGSTLNSKEMLIRERLYVLFELFDKDSECYLVAPHITSILNHIQKRQYTHEEVVAKLAECKIGETEHINFEKFCEVMAKFDVVPEEETLRTLISKTLA